MTEEQNRTTSPLGVALQRYLDARSTALIAARRALGINEVDARALLYIAGHPGVRPSDLLHYLGITSAGVTTVVDRLVERGAVRRERDRADGRVARLHLDVRLDVEPWDALSRFDTEFETATTQHGLDHAGVAAETLEAIMLLVEHAAPPKR